MLLHNTVAAYVFWFQILDWRCNARLDRCTTDVCSDASAVDSDDGLLFTDKKENAWTISRRFKEDILSFIGEDLGGNCTVAIELGAHVGLTTGLLSRHCNQVWAVEHSSPVLESNMQRNSRFTNIIYLEMHSVLDDWKQKLPRNKLNRDNFFVFIDAAHDRASVINDMERASIDLGARWLILDDYGAEKGVREAVQSWTAHDVGSHSLKGRVHRYIGERPPWSFSDRTVDDWEGIIVEVLPSPRDAAGQTGTSQVQPALWVRNTTWVIYPPGVFLTGSFEALGRLHLSAEPGEASLTLQPSSHTAFLYGAEWRAECHASTLAAIVDSSMEYRPMFEAPEVENGFVLAGKRLGRWQFRFTASRTGGLLLPDADEQVTFVLVAETMVRTIGEKLLSALY